MTRPWRSTRAGMRRGRASFRSAPAWTCPRSRSPACSWRPCWGSASRRWAPPSRTPSHSWTRLRLGPRWTPAYSSGSRRTWSCAWRMTISAPPSSTPSAASRGRSTRPCWRRSSGRLQLPAPRECTCPLGALTSRMSGFGSDRVPIVLRRGPNGRSHAAAPQRCGGALPERGGAAGQRLRQDPGREAGGAHRGAGACGELDRLQGMLLRRVHAPHPGGRAVQGVHQPVRPRHGHLLVRVHRGARHGPGRGADGRLPARARDRQAGEGLNNSKYLYH
mmetsp:Transcript_22756/g.70697  ORF Transcript_22756/g.70697 Transcript_22756/m.70697 type:complete len:276 (-) Transcript_22756:43-870(-)